MTSAPIIDQVPSSQIISLHSWKMETYLHFGKVKHWPFVSNTVKFVHTDFSCVADFFMITK